MSSRSSSQIISLSDHLRTMNCSLSSDQPKMNLNRSATDLCHFAIPNNNGAKPILTHPYKLIKDCGWCIFSPFTHKTFNYVGILLIKLVVSFLNNMNIKNKSIVADMDQRHIPVGLLLYPVVSDQLIFTSSDKPMCIIYIIRKGYQLV